MRLPQRRVWTSEEVIALGVTTDVPTLADILGIGRTKAYELARADLLPVPVFRFGSRFVVPVAPVLRLLGFDEPQPRTADAAGVGTPC